MSVAFRRESDEEHKEPRPELPIPPGPNLVTPRGLAMIEARTNDLEAALAVTTGEEAVAAVKRDLRYWHHRRATAQLAPMPSGDEAAFGTRVRYRLNGGAETEAEIVGADEADPTSGRIAFTAPLARALIGAGPGERVDFGGKAGAIEIIAVAPIG
jgi:transcription elongation GreA/GreB family factor